MLFIMSNSEDGLRCETLERSQWDEWITERTESIRAECRPVFVDEPPTDSSPTNEYFVVDGRVLRPLQVEVVVKYVLPTKQGF